MNSNNKNVAKRKGNAAEQHITATKYEGPIPPSSELERYNKIDPTFADRIMKMAENQAEHRQSMEDRDASRNDKALRLSGRDSLIGLIFGMIIVMSALFLAGYMIVNKELTGGIFTIFGLITAIAGVFVYGKKN